MRSSKRKLSIPADSCGQSQQAITRCELCNGSDINFTKPQQWGDKEACALAESLVIPPAAPVCQACRRDIGRVLSDSNFTPRWVKNRDKVRACAIQNCTAEVFVTTKSITLEGFQSALSATHLNAIDPVTSPIPLCKYHYFVLYYLSPSQTNCASCGVSLQHTSIRPCPNAIVIENHLREKTGFKGHISDADKVCINCYKFHLTILQ